MISIVIRTYNEEKSLVKTLEEICSQEINENFEVIIVDSGSVDRTLEIAEKYGCKIYKIPREVFTYPSALNFGTKKAEGDLIVYLSAHSIPLNNQLLHHMTKHFKDKEVAGVFGRQVSHEGINPIEEEISCRVFPRAGGSLISFSCSGGAVRKELWRRIPFDERVPPGKAKSYPLVEDQLWAKKVMKSGYKIVYEPTAEYYHSHPFSFGYFYRKYYGGGYFYKEVEGLPRNKLRTAINTLKYLIRSRYYTHAIVYPLYAAVSVYAYTKGVKSRQKVDKLGRI